MHLSMSSQWRGRGEVGYRQGFDIFQKNLLSKSLPPGKNVRSNTTEIPHPYPLALVVNNAPINVKPAGGRRGIGRDFDIFQKITVKFPTPCKNVRSNIAKFPTPRNDLWSRARTKIQISLPPGQQENSNALPPGQSDRSKFRPMHLSMSSRRGERRGVGRDFDRSLWPGGRAFEFSCCPGDRDI